MTTTLTGVPSISIQDQLLIDLATAVISDLTVTLTDHSGNAYTKVITAGDLTITPTYELLPSFLGTGITAFPNSYYVVTLTKDLEKAVGCVLSHPNLDCEIWDALRTIYATEPLKASQLPMMYESIIVTEDCDSCDCNIAQGIYCLLINELSSPSLDEDCNC